ncbi:hypothetical protein vseg_010445 [Gypsophila vaccaria]
MEQGEKLIEYVNMLNGLLDELKKIEVKLEEEDKALLLLNSLLDTYETYVDMILCGKDTITVDLVQVSLLSFNAMKKDKVKIRDVDIVALPGLGEVHRLTEILDRSMTNLD